MFKKLNYILEKLIKINKLELLIEFEKKNDGKSLLCYNQYDLPHFQFLKILVNEVLSFNILEEYGVIWSLKLKLNKNQ